MVKATTDVWLKGWDERNGGNISLRVSDEDISAYRECFRQDRVIEIGETVEGLGGQNFLLTGSGKYFRDV
jgi:rhamnulose-1-phosphate aldolase